MKNPATIITITRQLMNITRDFAPRNAAIIDISIHNTNASIKVGISILSFNDCS
jgi:hypothetical protein